LFAFRARSFQGADRLTRPVWLGLRFLPLPLPLSLICLGLSYIPIGDGGANLWAGRTTGGLWVLPLSWMGSNSSHAKPLIDSTLRRYVYVAYVPFHLFHYCL